MQKLSPGWQDLTDLQWQEACRREAVIRPLAEQGTVSLQEAAAAAERMGPARFGALRQETAPANPTETAP
jgi:hypothetical protein